MRVRRLVSRPSLALMLGVAVMGLTACGTTRPVQQMVDRVPEPSPEEALAAYRAEIESSAQQSDSQVAMQAGIVGSHVSDTLGPRALSEFELFIYINRTAAGPMSQRAFLFEKDGMGGLRHLDTWLVSTGREQREKSPKGAEKFTTTPTGVFQFDLANFSRLHKSNAWEADMPWAMFLKQRNGAPTDGIALHASLDKYVHNLGQRASAGCIRLLPSNAEKLYKLLQTRYAGTVPVTKSIGDTGVEVTDKTVAGTKALVIVDDANAQALVARYGQSTNASLRY